MVHTRPDYIVVYGVLALFATFPVAVVSTGSIVFARALRELRRRWHVDNTPRSHIGWMAMGLVEVEAKIVHGSDHRAPFSGLPCAYWEVTVERLLMPGVWLIVHRNRSDHPFFVRDDTGVALVLPKGAEIRGLESFGETCFGNALPAYYAQYLKEHHLGAHHRWELSQFRFTERRFEENVSLFLLGTAVPGSMTVAVSQDADVAATGTDGPHEHRIRELQTQTVATIRQGESDRLFIISQQSERCELGPEWWSRVIGGPVLALVGLCWWLGLVSSLQSVLL